jgi:hypothetical protein
MAREALETLIYGVRYIEIDGEPQAEHATINLLGASAEDDPDNGRLNITLGASDNAISNAMLANMAANSIKMNPTAGVADPQDVTFAANTFPARGSTGNLAAKSITDQGLALLAASAVALSMLAPQNAATVVGRAVGAGTGVPTALDASDLYDILLPITLAPGNLLAASSVGDAIFAWGTTAGYIQIGDTAGITGIHHVATTDHVWYIGGNNEMALTSGGLTLPTNNLVLTAGVAIFGSTPADSGTARFTAGDRLSWNYLGNTVRALDFGGTTTGYLTLGQNSENFLGVIVDTGATKLFAVRANEVNQLVIQAGTATLTPSLLLPTADVTLTAGSLNVTAGAAIFGANPAGGGTVRFSSGSNISIKLANGNTVNVLGEIASNQLLLGTSDAALSGGVRVDVPTGATFDVRVNAVSELQVDAGGVYIPSNILTFGASPSSVGTIRSENEFSIGSETVGGTSVSLLRFASNNYLYFGGTANPSNIVGAVFTLDTSFQVDMGGNTELILTTSALTLATNNLVLTAGSQTITAGSLNVTAGVITQGSTVANSGSHRVGPSWSLVGVATDTSDTTLFSFGSNQIQIGTTNDLSEMNFHLASGAYRTFVASVEKFRVDTNAVYVYTRLEVGAAPADAGSIRLSNENSIQWAGSGGGAYSGLWLDSSETLQHGGSNVIGHTFDSDSTGVYSFMWEGSEQLELSYAAAVTTITSGGALVVRSASGENLTLYCPGDGVFEITKNDGATEVFSIRDDGSARFFGAVTGTVITSRPTWATGGSASSLALVLERWGLLEVTGD